MSAAAEGKLVPTDEQQVIIEAGRKESASIMISSDAGCTKTTTLELVARVLPPRPALAVAFNKKTAQELQLRFPAYFHVKTMSGLGYSAWAKKLGGAKLQLSEYKVSELLKEVAREEGADGLSDEDWSKAIELVRNARQAGLIHESFPQYRGLIEDEPMNWEDLYEEPQPKREIIELAREVLKRSTEQAHEGTVDFDEMVYCSVLMGGVYMPYPLVMVDEMQDLNVLNIMQLGKVSRERIIAVGDPKQSIYQFRGAAEDSIERIRALKPRWLDFPLNTTFRCPEVMVKRQLWHAPNMRAAPGNARGEVYCWTRVRSSEEYSREPIQFHGLAADGWTWRWLRSLKEPGEKIFVLCRNNGPLLRLAFKLIREGVRPEMLGRDLGKALIGLVRKIAPKDATTTERFLELVERWKAEQVRAARDAKRHWLVAGIVDRADCLQAVAETTSARDVAGLKEAIRKLFSTTTGEVTLSTIHKAKGLEASVVLHLDPWRIPSRYALEAAEAGDESQLKQENNLKYVCETRTKRVFVEANVEDFLND